MTVTATQVSALLDALDKNSIQFDDVIDFINQNYHYTPVAFVNGEAHNVAGTNEKSAQIFGFAKLHGLSQLDTLKLFAEHYQAVQANPSGNDHANIRNFLYWGWQAFSMPQNPLTPK